MAIGAEKSRIVRGSWDRRAIGYGNEPPGALCFHPIVAPGSEHMKQSTVQLISFLVLAAVVLATGFGAIGGPAMLAGGF